MNHLSTHFLRCVLVGLSLIVLALCVYLSSEFWSDQGILDFRPLVITLYLSSIPFYVAIYQTFKLLSHIDRNQAFSHHTVAALRIIRNCGATFAVIYTLAIPIFFDLADRDDAPGLFALNLLFIFAATVITVFATVLQKLVQSAIAVHAEHDLTV